jgi:anhydro-N-acetylmuramic acid kinase
MQSLGISGNKEATGIQAALLSLDKRGFVQNRTVLYFPYPESLQSSLFLLHKKLTEQAGKPDAALDNLTKKLDEEITKWSLQISKGILEKNRARPAIIGYNGQPLNFALPPYNDEGNVQESRFFKNLGNARVFQEKSCIPVIADFQETDLSYGGNGAFLEASYLQNWANQAIQEGSLEEASYAFLELRDAARIILTEMHSEQPLAFEAGPGLSLAKELLQRVFQQHENSLGKMASRGDIQTSWVNDSLKKVPLAKLPAQLCVASDYRPFLDFCLKSLLPLDGLSSLLAFSAGIITKSLQIFKKAKAIILTRQNDNNPFFKSLLTRSIPVLSASTFGNDPVFLEAESCAFNALQFLMGIPTSFPTTTGVKAPFCCGRSYDRKEPSMTKRAS